MTEREREIVAGEADISDSYRYQTVSRVRRRIQENLPEDMEALKEHGELMNDFLDVACN